MDEYGTSLMTLDDLAKTLHVSTRTIERKIFRKDNPLPAFQDGKGTSWHCTRDDFNTWINSLKKTTGATAL